MGFAYQVRALGQTDQCYKTFFHRSTMRQTAAVCIDVADLQSVFIGQIERLQQPFQVTAVTSGSAMVCCITAVVVGCLDGIRGGFGCQGQVAADQLDTEGAVGKAARHIIPNLTAGGIGTAQAAFRCQPVEHRDIDAASSRCHAF